MKIFILVEGQTEETFVKQILAPHLEVTEKFVIPILVNTKRVVDGPNYRGGLTSYVKVNRDLLNLLRDRSVGVVTTMFDFYGIPEDWPGYDTLPNGDCYARVEHLEAHWGLDINDTRFIPNLMLHEFETLALVDPTMLQSSFPDKNRQIEALTQMVEGYDSPEYINEGKATAPSKRILAKLQAYRKSLHGPLLCSKLGLQRLRESCRHFDEWVTRLENA